MNNSKHRKDVIKRIRAIVVSTLTLFSVLAFITPGISQEAQASVITQTTSSDFDNASLKWNVDTTSDPGNVSLIPSPTDWIKGQANPVLSVGPEGWWDDRSVASPSVLKDGLTHKMWYMGLGSETTYWQWKIGYAESANGLSWGRREVPVFEADPTSPWEYHSVERPYVLKTGNTYRMWYSGNADPTGTTNRVGYAESHNGIDWTRITTSPVLEPSHLGEWDGVAIWKVSVLFEHGKYKMWYTGHDGVNCQSSIGYAESNNGINWTKYSANPVLIPGSPGSWDDRGIEVSHVEMIGEQYFMWYNRHCPSQAIGIAISSDGINWTKYSGNPVIEKGEQGSWDEYGVTWATLLRDSNSIRMWFSGEGSLGSWKMRIGYATAAYGLKFTKALGNPVLDFGNIAEWDKGSVKDPFVYHGSREYMMWYSSPGANAIGNARSEDGISWTKHPDNPVLSLGSPGSWDSVNVYGPWVLYEDGIYKMWYSGHGSGKGHIGYATSDDGISWNRPILGLVPFGVNSQNNIVLPPGSPGEFDAGGVSRCSVLKDDDTYKMWYTGWSGHEEIGYAESPDGLNWTKYSGNPVLRPGIPREYDSVHVSGPSVAKVGPVYQMWFGGDSDYAGGKIGLATSRDGINWTKNLVNPVVEGRPPGSWDGLTTYFPSVFTESQMYHMYYAGIDNPGTSGWKIGFADTSHQGVGQLVSNAIDAGTNAMSWVGIDWDETIRPNTMISLAYRTSDDAVSWTNWSEEYESQPVDISSLDVKGRFFQYRATLVSIDGRFTPTLSEVRIGYRLSVSLYFRIAGEKWHDVEIYLYEDGVEIGSMSVTRVPGSPDDQIVKIADVDVDFSKTYSAVAYYTPEDDSLNGKKWGANPAWVIMRFGDEEIVLHHTFNVKHKNTWVWSIEDLNIHIPHP